jgi:hypothetical protein
MDIGLSLYLSSGMEKNLELIEKAKNADMKYAFTSLHIPEENRYSTDAVELIKLCGNAGIKLIVDVSPHALEKYKLKSYEQLQELGVEYLRPDFGFRIEEIIRLSKTFHIVFNASTAKKPDLDEMQRNGVDFSRILGCHNFYPKPLTGISLQKVKSVNDYLKSLGIMALAFVPGDKTLRGPIYEGLPTVETHRGSDVFASLLELEQQTDVDAVLIGDIDVTDKTWGKIAEYSCGRIALNASISEEFSYLKNMIFHERVDYSGHVIRCVESRQLNKKVKAGPVCSRPQGSIFISNENFLRYEGEVEIARVDLPPDSRVCVIGNIDDDDIKYLKFIIGGGAFVLK